MARRAAVAAAVSAVFAIHVVCTALYLLPRNPLTYAYIVPVTRYIEPLFAQRWLLFAPEPATNSLKLWTRYECGGRWTGWRDPAAPLMKTHQRNRLSPAGKRLYISTSLARDLSRQTADTMVRLNCGAGAACEARWKAEVRQLPAFRRAIAYSVRNAPCRASSVQFLVAQLYPTQFSERKKQKPFSFGNIFEYDPVRVDASSARSVE